MNGRLYDPAVGRFLSPDENVSFPGYSQSFNRYAYALNNPLSVTDPDGENPLIILGAILGGWMGMGKAMINSDKQGWGLVGDMFKGLFVGAASGAAGAWAGGAAASAIGTGGFLGGAASGTAGGFTAGFVGGAGNAWMNGAGFGTGLIAGVNIGITSGLISGSIGGLIGGFDALSNDASFWDGHYEGEVGGLGKSDWEAKFLDEEIPAGARPTNTGEIVVTDENPNYGKYGWTRNGGAKPHYGVDYAGEVGDEVYSMYDGKVTRLWNSRAYGPNATRIYSTINGKYYNVDYGHLSKSALALNQVVSVGGLVGYMGRLGNIAGTSFPTHVHIAIWRPLPGNVMGFVMPWCK